MCYCSQSSLGAELPGWGGWGGVAGKAFLLQGGRREAGLVWKGLLQ